MVFQYYFFKNFYDPNKLLDGVCGMFTSLFYNNHSTTVHSFAIVIEFRSTYFIDDRLYDYTNKKLL